MFRICCTLAAVCLFSSAALCEPKRQAGAHAHGHGTLNIAVEGTTVAMSLDAPGADIAGFEHEAKTDADKAALATAKARLAKPLDLFKLPAEAQCSVTSAAVKMETDESGDHAGHGDFNADYKIGCADTGKLNAVTFAYFDVFKGAEALTVNIVTDKGQTSAEATRKKPVVSLP